MPYVGRRPQSHPASKEQEQNTITINSRVQRNTCGKQTLDSEHHHDRI